MRRRMPAKSWIESAETLNPGTAHWTWWYRCYVKIVTTDALRCGFVRGCEMDPARGRFGQGPPPLRRSCARDSRAHRSRLVPGGGGQYPWQGGGNAGLADA